MDGVTAGAAGLAIGADLLAVIGRAAAQAYPEECCGLLVGVDDGSTLRVTRLVLAPNRHPEPRTGFEIDPTVLIATLRGLREAEGASGPGERLLGHMHSHPDAPARPSERDRAMAFETGAVWMIVPVEKGIAGPPRAFQAAGEGDAVTGFEALPIVSVAAPNGSVEDARENKESP